MALHLIKLETPLPKDSLCQVCSKLAKRFRRRRFLNIFNRNLLFRYYLPLKKGMALHLNKLETPLPKDALCEDWLKLAKRFWRRRFLNMFNRNLLFRYYLPFKKGMALHLNTLEAPLPKDALCHICFKFARRFWRRRFLNILNRNLLFRYYLPHGERHVPSFVQTWSPSTQGCFVPNLVEIGRAVWEKKLLNIFKNNFTISLLSPFGERHGPAFEQTWSPSTCFVPSLVEIGPVVLEKKLKMWKVYRRTDRRLEKLIWAFSSGELKFNYNESCFMQCIHTNIFILTKGNSPS